MLLRERERDEGTHRVPHQKIHTLSAELLNNVVGHASKRHRPPIRWSCAMAKKVERSNVKSQIAQIYRYPPPSRGTGLHAVQQHNPSRSNHQEILAGA